MTRHKISTKFLSIEKVEKIIDRKQKIELSQEAIDAVQKCRAYLDKKTDTEKEPIYGVTTGFGSLCNRSISKEDLTTLHVAYKLKEYFAITCPVPPGLVIPAGGSVKCSTYCNFMPNTPFVVCLDNGACRSVNSKPMVIKDHDR